MDKKWFYCNQEFSTQSAVNEKVLQVKQRLDNNPTEWAIVKCLGGNAESGWIIPQTTLTDQQINNLTGENFFSVASVISGVTVIGVTASDALKTVFELRQEYAQHFSVNNIVEVNNYAPTQFDMSGYI